MTRLQRTIVGISVCFCSCGPNSGTARAAPAARPVVVVELYSSEGCSSCPPAENRLRELDRTQPIPGVTLAVLELHVDYWNDLGWRDAYSKPEFSERQRAYARAFSSRQIFTPEIILQGERVASAIDLGSERAFLEEKAHAAHADVVVTRRGKSVDVRVTNVGADAKEPEVWLAVTESGLVSPVLAGENGGERLHHAPVVRTLVRAGSVSSPTFDRRVELDIRPEWQDARLRVIGFVQDRGSRRILGAATT